MKWKGLSRGYRLALSFAMILLCAGCESFRWGERTSEDLDELNKSKTAESHYWPALTPDRSLQDPAWTP